MIDLIVNDILMKFGNQNIGGIIPDVTVEENLVDTVTITDHPVETGCEISDHAVLNPSEITVKVGWSNSKNISQFLTGRTTMGVQDAYDRLRKLKDDRKPFDVVTTKRTYRNMLIKSLAVTNDVTTHTALIVTAVLRQVIIVSTQTVKLDPKNQKNPEDTAPIDNKGTSNPREAPSGTSSAIADDSKKW